MIAVTLLIFVFIAVNFDLDEALAVASDLPAAAVLLVILAVTVNLAGSCLRLRLVLQDFGFRPSVSQSTRAALYGTVGGLVFFQFIGQTLTRQAVLSRTGVPASATFLLSLYERAVSTAILAAIAGAGLFYLFGTLTLDLDRGGFEFLKLAASGVAALAAGATIGFSSLLRRALSVIAHREVGLRLLRLIAVTLVFQLTMLAAYVILAEAVASPASTFELCAASAIVMFAAALPISFGGWGVRELSAVAAFGAIGVETPEALTISVTIGICSQAILFAAAGLMSLRTNSSVADRGQGGVDGLRSGLGIDYFSVLTIALPIAAAIAVFFQVKLPVGGGEINVNLADPIVIAGAFACLAAWRHTRSAGERWRVPAIELAVAVFAAVLVCGFAIGLFRYGMTEWALYNRVVGALVLVAYVLTGALATVAHGSMGRTVVLRSFVVAGAAVVCVDWFFYIFDELGISLAALPTRMVAMAGNPNALGFQMMMAAVIMVAVPSIGRSAKAATTSMAITGFVLAGLWLSGSRASIAALITLIAIAAFMRIVNWRSLISAIAVAAILVLTLLVASRVGMVFGLDTDAGALSRFHGWRAAVDESDVERWASIWQAFDLFFQYPIFGAGLGAFHHQSLSGTGRPLIIHSTPVWVLTEFGVLGFGIVAVAFAGFVRSLWRRWTGKRADTAIIIALLAVGVMLVEFLVHDMLFQRSFWFLLGICLAQPLVLRTRPPSQANGDRGSHRVNDADGPY